MASRRLELLGAPLDPLTLAETADAVERAIIGGTSTDHVSINAAKVVEIQDDHSLRHVLWDYSMATADGQGVVWAARLLGRPVPERIAGIDLMEMLLERANERAYRVYLLGARPDVLAGARTEIERRYPNLIVAGSQHGYYDPATEADVVNAIAGAGADLLFVALATPQKELFLARHRAALDVGFAMGVGGAFDILAGERRRAPQWVQRAGFEWFFRLAQEPQRLAGRYVTGNARFAGLVLREAVRIRRSAPAARKTEP